MTPKILTILATFILVMSVATAGVTLLVLELDERLGSDAMPSFSTYNELERFLDEASDYDGYLYPDFFGTPVAGGDELREDYSETNVQVEGIDEADIVKTDGRHIFVANGDSVTILEAYPPDELEVEYVIGPELLGAEQEDWRITIHGLYVTEETLVVISSVYIPIPSSETEWSVLIDAAATASIALYMPPEVKTIVSVFDLSDSQTPHLLDSFCTSGYPLTSRMMSGVVYTVSQSRILRSENGCNIPEITVDGATERIPAERIKYDPDTNCPSYFATMTAIDLAALKMDYMTIVCSWTSTIYMSYAALYLTFEKWSVAPIDILDGASDENDITTTIYKVSVDGIFMKVTARGDVTGTLLNQFSMDESDGFLRVATTTGWTEPRNAVYVLDENLKTVGSLEDLAPTEWIYSARFVGETLYLVTFRQIDPLFVIDLSDPKNPHVLGELEIPGFSNYLHMLDDDHVLGIGRENESVKISLFDVSVATSPLEVDKYTVEGYSYTSASWDHRAILIDPEMELLVISIDWYDDNWTRHSAAFVFHVSPDDGITLRGTIEHGEKNVLRSLYIGDYLYTISSQVVKVNLLDDLSAIDSLQYK